MTKLFTLMALAAICQSANGQTEPGKESDTIRIGNIIITKQGNKSNDDDKDRDRDKDFSTHVTWGKNHSKPGNVSTNWGIVDLGFANYSDETNYALAGSYLYNRAGTVALGKGDFKLNVGKSVNVNIWFFMQRLNLIKQHVNLKYGLGLELNNYRYRSSANISYLEQNPYQAGQSNSPLIIRDSIHFSKNKLAADYVTVPLMLNFSTSPGYTNKGLSLSAGISAGYLYSQRNKQVSSERGKQKNGGDYDLERFKLSYVAEIGLGPVRLYGSYSPKSFYSTGLNMKPYTVGVRLSNW
ncbi:MAG: outer membrane beta-barrel protein [Ferruginibacter sp.]